MRILRYEILSQQPSFLFYLPSVCKHFTRTPPRKTSGGAVSMIKAETQPNRLFFLPEEQLHSD